MRAALRQLQALLLELVEAGVEVATLCQLFGRALVDLEQGLGAVASLLGMIGSTLFISEPHSTGLERSASCRGLVTTARKILSRTHQALLAARKLQCLRITFGLCSFRPPANGSTVCQPANDDCH